MLLFLGIGCDNEYMVSLKKKWENMSDDDVVVAEVGENNDSEQQGVEKVSDVKEETTNSKDVTPGVVKKRKKRKKKRTVTQKKTVVKIPKPLEGKSLFDICLSNGLSLIKWSYEERQSQKECCSSKLTQEQREDLFCDMNWPFGDVPRCSVYDKMQREIWARYGKVFTSEKVQKHFEAQDWYQANEDFRTDWLSTTAQSNIEQLQNMSRKKMYCLSE